jgi:hypothetical protein
LIFIVSLHQANRNLIIVYYKVMTKTIIIIIAILVVLFIIKFMAKMAWRMFWLIAIIAAAAVIAFKYLL